MVFKCNTCESPFSNAFEAAEHENIHTGLTPFMCPSCGSNFQSIDKYVEHARKFPSPHFFPCQHCNAVFFDSCSLGVHNEQHPGKESIDPLSTIDNYSLLKVIDPCKPVLSFKENTKLVITNARKESRSDTKSLKKKIISCKGCPKTFMSKKMLQIHRQKFPMEHDFKCNECCKSFTNKLKLQKHLCLSPSTDPVQCSCLLFFNSRAALREHAGSKPYKCCACSLEFNELGNLMRHIRTHTQQKPYTCKFCGRGFTQSANLRNHITMHFGDNPMKCDQCSFTCKTSVGLFKHKKKHLMGMDGSDLRKISSSTFECAKCKKSFKFIRNLAMHMKVHEEEHCLCPDCGKLFNNAKVLKKHVKRVHAPPVPCPECGKLFANLPSFKHHFKTHVPTKTFVCKICLRTFALHSYLTQHIKTHNKDKIYSCDHCNKKFKVASSLKYHHKVSCQADKDLAE